MKTLRITFISIIILLGTGLGQCANLVSQYFSPTFTSQNITYQSLDDNNRPITLSAKISYLKGSTINFMVMNCHYTITSNQEVPTGSSPGDKGIIDMVASEGALIISPDYIGYGESKGDVQPYCNHIVTARSCLDAQLAAIEYVKKLGMTFSSDCYTYVFGVSQGGEASLAYEYYVENIASEADQKLVNLKKVFSAAGPCNLNIMYDDYTTQSDLTYPVGLCMCLMGFQSAYKEGCMHEITDDSKLYSQKFIEAHIADSINSRAYSTAAINKAIRKCLKGSTTSTITAADILNADVLNEQTSTYRAVKKAVALNNLYAYDWTPRSSIVLYHKVGDPIINYSNTEATIAFMQEKKADYVLIDETEYLNKLQSDQPLAYMMMNTLASQASNDHLRICIKFIFMFASGELR